MRCTRRSLMRILYNLFPNSGYELCKPSIQGMQVYTALCITLCIVCKTQCLQGIFLCVKRDRSNAYPEYMQKYREYSGCNNSEIMRLFMLLCQPETGRKARKSWKNPLFCQNKKVLLPAVFFKREKHFRRSKQKYGMKRLTWEILYSHTIMEDRECRERWRSAVSTRQS